MMAPPFTSTALAAQQDALLAAVMAPHSNAPARGLAAYRANAHASAERALQAAYPVMAQLVGSDNFAYLARDFWQHHPPVCGDLAQWGDALPTFLSTSKQLADTPYLADVAHIEWALHACAGAADCAPDTASFALLTQQDPEHLVLSLAPGAQVLASVYPAAAIVLAHQGQGTLAQAAALLQAGVGDTALVWRQGFAPCLRALPASERSFTHAVCQRQSLAQALDAAALDFDFSAWLSARVQDGFLLGTLLAQAA
jgi:Putative DNA-binding domain